MNIEMTSRNGITLLTAGKRCTEDITVIPTFATAEQASVYFESDGGYTYFTVNYTSNGVSEQHTLDGNGQLLMDKDSLFLIEAFSNYPEDDPDYPDYAITSIDISDLDDSDYELIYQEGTRAVVWVHGDCALITSAY